MAEWRRNRSLFTLNDEVAAELQSLSAAIFAFAPKPAV
jgi:hypothetical protein